jgi:hypothetical protein
MDLPEAIQKSPEDEFDFEAQNRSKEIDKSVD